MFFFKFQGADYNYRHFQLLIWIHCVSTVLHYGTVVLDAVLVGSSSIYEFLLQ